MDWNSRRITAIIENALNEDRATRDATSYACGDPNQRASATIIAKQECILAGLGCIPRIFDVYAALDGAVTAHYEVTSHPSMFDGVRVNAGQQLAVIRHNARVILSCERVILNFLQRMAGIATTTRKFVDAVEGTHVRILDTRKTAPGLRVIDKYAVRCGGGQNHRLDLSDGVLIKSNHVALAGGAVPALERAIHNRRGSNPARPRKRRTCPPSRRHLFPPFAPYPARMRWRYHPRKRPRLRRDRSGFHLRRSSDAVGNRGRYESASQSSVSAVVGRSGCDCQRLATSAPPPTTNCDPLAIIPPSPHPQKLAASPPPTRHPISPPPA